MNSNPLPQMLLAYNMTKDSFRIAKRAIKTQEPITRQRLLQRTCVETSPLIDAERMIEKSNQESDALFVLNMWATFERFIKNDLQKRGQILCNTHPHSLGKSIYKLLEKEIEFWKPGEILDCLKDSLFKDKADLIGHARQILWCCYSIHHLILTCQFECPRIITRNVGGQAGCSILILF